jgi:hypothetical protein
MKSVFVTKIRPLAGVVLALSALGMVGMAGSVEASCRVNDPDDPTLNVRSYPNGPIINRLRNGRVVHIKQTIYDKKGRPWVWVEGRYKGKWRKWGYVFRESLYCD